MRPPGHWPWFSVAWLAATSLAYAALADAHGFVRGWPEAFYFVPARVAEEPWRALLAPIGMVFSHDAIQLGYVVGVFALVVIPFEIRFGSRPTAIAFVAGGAVSALLVAFLVIAPLTLVAPAHPVVELSWNRFYAGGSTGVFAVAGAFAGRLRGRARAALLLGAIAWEGAIAAGYYRFGELIPLFHLGAIGVGFALPRSVVGHGPTTS